MNDSNLILYALQDIEGIGDVIYRHAINESEAIKLAKKDYPRTDFNCCPINEMVGF